MPLILTVILNNYIMVKKFIVTFRNSDGLEYNVLLDSPWQVIGAISGAAERNSELISVFPLSSDILEDIKNSLK